MNINKRIAITGAIAGASLGLLAGSAMAASAAQARPADVPSCVTYSDADWATTLHNTCGNSQKVQVIISWGLDSGCLLLQPGETYVYHYAWPGSFDHIQSC